VNKIEKCFYVDVQELSVRGKLEHNGLLDSSINSQSLDAAKAASTLEIASDSRLCRGHKLRPCDWMPRGHDSMGSIGATALMTSKIEISLGFLERTKPPPMPR
jgi:hypothetical protein